MNSSLYIVAGPNGAGKTTFAREFLPNYVECLEFVNADLIASGLSPFSPEHAAIRAGRLMLERIHFLADRGTDFGFETTLSGKGYVRLLKDLKNRGYKVYLYFLWIDNVNLYRPILDFWAIFDNSTHHPVKVACEEDGDLEVFDSVLFSKLSKDMVRS